VLPWKTGINSKVKRILKYLKGTVNKGILYRSNDPRKIIAFSDADYSQDVKKHIVQLLVLFASLQMVQLLDSVSG